MRITEARVGVFRWGDNGRVPGKVRIPGEAVVVLTTSETGGGRPFNSFDLDRKPSFDEVLSVIEGYGSHPDEDSRVLATADEKTLKRASDENLRRNTIFGR